MADGAMDLAPKIAYDMAMPSQHPTRVYSFFLAIFFLLVVVLASWLLFKASGYQVLRHPVRIVKTGLISLGVHPSDGLSITLNNSKTAPESRAFTNLVPGRYQIRIERSGYRPWEMTTELSAGQAISYPDVVLFYQNPIRMAIESDQTKIYETVLAHPERFQMGLHISESELWAHDVLITRYSEPIKQAFWLVDNTHLVLQVGQTLHAIDNQGGQDNELVTYDPAVETIERFAPLLGGQKIIVQTTKRMELVEITAPFQRLTLPTL